MPSYRLLLRFITVGGLVLLLLLPLGLIRNAIHERQEYRDEAVTRVAQSTAGAQGLVGPLRVVPYTETTEVDEEVDGRAVRKTQTVHGYVLQAPQRLDITSELAPDTRRVGLHEVRVYEWRAKARARFDEPLPADTAARKHGAPYLVVGLADVRGLVGTPVLRLDGRAARLLPGTRDMAGFQSGVHAPLPATGVRDVALDFALAGTETLAIVPIGDSNHVAMRSSWPHPQFGGRFLPRTRSVDAGGFRASWDVSSLASAAQGQLERHAVLVPGQPAPDPRRTDATARAEALGALEVRLVDPVDVHTQADRASKYGVLFVVLTFVGFALFELIKRLPIHPLQYLLVGLALAIFFLLLLSLSEHIPFWLAYVIAAAACIGLQGVYLSHVLRSRARGIGFAAMLTALYAALYGLLVSEDNALLMGSLLLFGILAAIMWVTRRVDWYALGANLR